MRPRQWVKNGVLFAALLFTLDQRHSVADLIRLLGGFACFCAIASATYLWNDLWDLEQDRKHPRKRHRPLASGRLPRRVASVALVVLLAAGVGGSLALGIPFAGVAIGYALLTLLYSVWLKHQVILDVMALAGGFVLRAVAGAVALAVEISPWLLVCTTLGALFLGLSKRRAEIALLADGAASHRPILSEYTVPLLDQLIGIVSASTLISYCLYTLSSKTGAQHPALVLTIFPVAYGLFRFLYLIHRRDSGGDPTADLLEDRPLMVAVLLWGAMVAAILRFSVR